MFTPDMTKRPYRITENGKTLATATTLRQAQVAVAKRIASDVEGRVLTISGPLGTYFCRNQGLTIAYVAAA